jgi:hypothetical protein
MSLNISKLTVEGLKNVSLKVQEELITQSRDPIKRHQPDRQPVLQLCVIIRRTTPTTHFLFQCKTNTIPILMHQMRISTNQVQKKHEVLAIYPKLDLQGENIIG